MIIRVLQGFRDYEPGQIFHDWPSGMCEVLIHRGLIEEVKEPVVERSVDEQEVERAEVTPRAGKKPRK